jgi:ribosomal protein S11
MNNIVVSVSTLDGEVISRCSGGMIGLKHRARASASAATDIARNAAQKAVEKGFKVTEVRLKGPSPPIIILALISAFLTSMSSFTTEMWPYIGCIM